MKLRLLILMLFTLFFSCSRDGEEKAAPQMEVVKDQKKEKKLQIITFKSDTIKDSKFTGWGYSIYLNNELIIYQPHIPAYTGNNGFKTKEDAEKTAKLIVSKIKNDILPPTVTKEELDSLGVLK